ncbi:hypothetical protein [Algoriphagus sp.]|uniref:hypothetical protein n=1 Tax=Algoriphagus sp. TaxID=1872435 RepID=UPI00391CD188
MFDIDIPTLALASVFIAATFAIFFYYSLKGKKARKEFAHKFNQFISGLNLNPNIKEDWRNRYVLGLDQQNKILVYCDFGENGKQLAIALPEVSKVDISELYLEPANAANSRKILENLALKVQFKNSNKSAIQLPIYSAEEYSDLLGETVLASSWAKIINQQLTK